MDYGLLSSALGYLSILCWLGAQFPQVIVNIQTKSVEGLALPFLANWLFGDITNLVGCILTHQLPFQTYLATYFVFVDLSLVAQYIYYYKPPLTYTPSPSPTPTLSPSLTLTPTAVVYRTPSGVIYSSRSLTRPTSRSRLLEGELESGVRFDGTKYDGRARSAPRAGTGSSRFSGVLSAYPPAGLLPTSDQIASTSTSNTIRGADKRPSLASLKKRLGGEEEEVKLKKRKSKERAASERSVEEMEEEDELSALADSFYSDVSAPNTGRRVSWSQASLPDVRVGGSEPRLNTTVLDPRTTITGEAQTDTGDSTPTQAQEELRQRSRSRGRPSTRTRAYPTLTYDYASPTIPASPTRPPQPLGSSLQPLTASDQHQQQHLQQPSDPAGSTLRQAQREELERELAAERVRQQSGSKSGSRRRSASIVFLSVGLGALLVMGGGTPTSSSVGRTSPTPTGEVLGWTSGPRVDPILVEPLHQAFGHKQKQSKARRPHDPPPLTPEQKRRIIGRISAWACTTLYLTSRLPQIWKNYTRKSVQGLSLALFVFAFLGNTFYVASILSTPVLWEYPSDGLPIEADVGSTSFPVQASFIDYALPHPSPLIISPLIFADPDPTPPVPPYRTPRARAFLKESLPYLLGSGGTLCFDVVIVTQGIVYGRRERLEEEESDSEEETDDEEGADDEDGEDREGEGAGKDVLEVGRRSEGPRRRNMDHLDPGDDGGG